jgi:hypothetical protein
MTIKKPLSKDTQAVLDFISFEVLDARSHLLKALNDETCDATDKIWQHLDRLESDS